MSSKTTTTYKLTTPQRRILSVLAKEKTAGLRARIILSLADGRTQAVTANKLGISPQTVSLWSRRFRDGGIEALADAPRSGRPPLSKALVERVCRARLGEITHIAKAVGVTRSTAYRWRQRHPELVPTPTLRNNPPPSRDATVMELIYYYERLRKTVYQRPGKDELTDKKG